MRLMSTLKFNIQLPFSDLLQSSRDENITICRVDRSTYILSSYEENILQHIFNSHVLFWLKTVLVIVRILCVHLCQCDSQFWNLTLGAL